MSDLISVSVIERIFYKIDNGDWVYVDNIPSDDQKCISAVYRNLPEVSEVYENENNYSWMSRKDLLSLQSCLRSIQLGGGNFYEDLGLLPAVYELYKKYDKESLLLKVEGSV